MSDVLADTASASTTGLDPINAALAAAFAGSETPEQVDNSSSEEAAPEAPEAEKPLAEAEEDKGTDKADGEEPPAAETPEAAADAEDEDDGFKALAGDEPKEYLTDPAELKAKFPRNSSNELIAQTAEYAAEAKEGHELKQALGGEHFIEPVKQIAQALQTGELGGLYDGVLAAKGSSGVLELFELTLGLGFVQAPNWSKNDQTKEFGASLAGVVDKALAARFGTGVTADKVQELARWEQLGWFEKIAEWTANNDVPYEEVEALLTATNDPKYAEILREKKELEAKLEANAAQEQSAATAEDSKIENVFGTTAEAQIEAVLNDVVWKNSVLKDNATDDADTKAAKAFFRPRLKADAVAAFVNSPSYKNLLNDYKAGKQGSAAFRTSMADAINAAILATKEPTSVAQKMLAKVYGQKRNTNLATKASTQTTPPALTPTVPADNRPAEVKTSADVQKTLEEAFKAFG